MSKSVDWEQIRSYYWQVHDLFRHYQPAAGGVQDVYTTLLFKDLSRSLHLPLRAPVVWPPEVLPLTEERGFLIWFPCESVEIYLDRMLSFQSKYCAVWGFAESNYLSVVSGLKDSIHSRSLPHAKYDTPLFRIFFEQVSSKLAELTPSLRVLYAGARDLFPVNKYISFLRNIVLGIFVVPAAWVHFPNHMLYWLSVAPVVLGFSVEHVLWSVCLLTFENLLVPLGYPESEFCLPCDNFRFPATIASFRENFSLGRLFVECNEPETLRLALDELYAVHEGVARRVCANYLTYLAVHPACPVPLLQAFSDSKWTAAARMARVHHANPVDGRTLYRVIFSRCRTWNIVKMLALTHPNCPEEILLPLSLDGDKWQHNLYRLLSFFRSEKREAVMRKLFFMTPQKAKRPVSLEGDIRNSVEAAFVGGGGDGVGTYDFLPF